MKKNILECLDSGSASFLVLGALHCQLRGNFLWHSEEIDECSATGVVFRGYEEIEDADPEYLGYALFADVTADPDEPDTRMLSSENLQETDDLIKREISKQFDVQDWWDPHLNNVEPGRKSLMNGYKVLDEGVIYQKISCRLTLEERKGVMIVCFKPDRSYDFGKSLWWTLENIKLL